MSSIFKVNGKDTEFIAANAPQANSSKAQPLLNGVQHVDKIVFNNQTVYNLTDEMSWVSYPELTPTLTDLSSYYISQTNGSFSPIDWCTTDPSRPVRLMFTYYFYRYSEQTPTQTVDYILPPYTGPDDSIYTQIAPGLSGSDVPGGSGSFSLYARRYKNGKLSLFGGSSLYADSGSGTWTLHIRAYPALPAQPYYQKNQTQSYDTGKPTAGKTVITYLKVRAPSDAVVWFVTSYDRGGSGKVRRESDDKFLLESTGRDSLYVRITALFKDRFAYLNFRDSGSLDCLTTNTYCTQTGNYSTCGIYCTSYSSTSGYCENCTFSAGASCGSIPCTNNVASSPCEVPCSSMNKAACGTYCTSNQNATINDPGTPEQPGIEEISQWAKQQDIDLSEFISNLNSQLVVFKETPPPRKETTTK